MAIHRAANINRGPPPSHMGGLRNRPILMTICSRSERDGLKSKNKWVRVSLLKVLKRENPLLALARSSSEADEGGGGRESLWPIIIQKL